MMKFLVLLLVSAQVFAGVQVRPLLRGNEKGNGGNFLACENNGMAQYQLLEFYEFSQGTAEPQITNWEDAVRSQIEQIRAVSPLRGENYAELLKVFATEAQFKTGGSFSSSDDVGPVMIPNGCHLVQVATQFYDARQNHYSFYLNSDVWNNLSEFQKAGLALHEILLTEAVQSGHVTSKRTRELNALLWNGELLKQGADAFHAYLQVNSGFRFVDKTQYWMELFDEQGVARKNEFWPNGQPMRIYSRTGTRACVDANCWITMASPDGLADLFFSYNGSLIAGYAQSGIVFWNGQPLKVKGALGFYPDGKLSKIELDQTLVWHRGNRDISLNQQVHFHPTQEIRSITFPGRMELSMLPEGPEVTVGDGGRNASSNFHPNGVFASGYIVGPAKIRNSKGLEYTIVNRNVFLNDKGEFN